MKKYNLDCIGYIMYALVYDSTLPFHLPVWGSYAEFGFIYNSPVTLVCS
jgi:hypothetical protein